MSAPATAMKDGREWRVGTGAEVAWIADGTRIGLTIAAAIPTVFAAYATFDVPDREDRSANDRAVLTALTEQSPDQLWWLGYLDTGTDDVVFPEVGRVSLYANWQYVLVEAGPQQAATWRSNDWRSVRGALPDVLFPTDRSWLVSTLWDDDWRCLGGPAALIDRFSNDRRMNAREVEPDSDATPPGHIAR